jgi:hypothetical protein
MEITEVLTVHVEGFDRQRPISVEIIRPDARREAWDIPPAYAGPLWFSAPGEPLGRYTLTARQAGNVRSGTFLVRAPREPSIALGPTWTIPDNGWLDLVPGEQLAIYLAGFQPNAAVSMHVYRPTGASISLCTRPREPRKACTASCRPSAPSSWTGGASTVS